MLMVVIVNLMIIALGFAFLVTTGYDNFGGITLQLDDMYTNTSEMACAAYEELIKQGRKCEILEMGKGCPKFLIEGKKYFMIYKMASIRGVPMQVVQFKLCRE